MTKSWGDWLTENSEREDVADLLRRMKGDDALAVKAELRALWKRDEAWEAEGWEVMPEPDGPAHPFKTAAEMAAEGQDAIENVKRAGGTVTDAGRIIMPDDEESEL